MPWAAVPPGTGRGSLLAIMLAATVAVIMMRDRSGQRDSTRKFLLAQLLPVTGVLGGSTQTAAALEARRQQRRPAASAHPPPSPERPL